MHGVSIKDLIIMTIMQAWRVLGIFTCSRNLHSPCLPLLVQASLQPSLMQPVLTKHN